MCDKAGTAGYIIMHTCNIKENITHKNTVMSGIYGQLLSRRTYFPLTVEISGVLNESKKTEAYPPYPLFNLLKAVI